jgi:hypothetical protein
VLFRMGIYTSTYLEICRHVIVVGYIGKKTLFLFIGDVIISIRQMT